MFLILENDYIAYHLLVRETKGSHFMNNNFIKKAALAVLLPMCSYANSTSKAPPTPFIEHHNRIVVFCPLHQAYERIKPDVFYVGVEGWFTGAFSKTYTVIAEGELRMGYNFFYNGRDHLTPVAGVGVFKDYREHHSYAWERDEYGYWHSHHTQHKMPLIRYGMIGFLYDHEFNSIFNLGANLKGMIGGGGSSKHFKWGSPVLGFDVTLPITFRFGHKRHWDARIELFDIYMHGFDISRNYFGFRSTVGYRF